MPNTSGKDLAKEFIRIGYRIVPGGGKGSHIKLERDNSPTIIIPGHRELRKGTELRLRKRLEEIKNKGT